VCKSRALRMNGSSSFRPTERLLNRVTWYFMEARRPGSRRGDRQSKSALERMRRSLRFR
jgi:hypothetical protein